MIDELRIYRLVPGGLADYLKFAGEVAMPLRGDSYGKLLGFWYGEIGSANCAFNLWQHEDLNTRQALREGLETMSEWRAQYLSRVQPLMQQTVIRLMTPVAEVSEPKEAGNTYELRIIRTKAGRAHELASRLMTEPPPHLKARTVGIWTTFAGTLNEVVQLCAYRDVRERLSYPLQHAEWRDFLGRHGPLAEEVESSLLIPVDFSPLQ
jgi:NIPSNAP